ncbi:PadR family transcriptional regulator [Streptacidiphilus jiangxiensis]|uniref:DNA-binding transcriptional regulator, PadR family n=1 Tax=Streptacidiphilus jiangxiensis TaxID=235985 RepID=A0A1H7RNZ3_STRJI|nr:PadR family transcriptional regulator [Streptacidiphilus jiangxiensis]SEL61718.1 DNA-binding transcriptional regulator, PadR family [Streptacidiphilus jiangxiensis]
MSAAPRSSPLALTVLALLHYRPLHPYGVQRLLKEWGKDQVVNVGQRAGLYRTMDRLLEAGLIAVRETGRDAQYPERTVYEVTDAGSEVAHRWLDEMLSTPKQEFPEFPAALSLLMLLTPAAMRDALSRRAATLERTLAAQAADLARESEGGLPRIASLEGEYVRTMTAAELGWLHGVLADLDAGRLAWSPEELLALANDGE